jgi:hypothetical protein
MWGYCEIVAMSRFKQEILIPNASNHSWETTQPSRNIDAPAGQESTENLNSMEYKYDGVTFTNSADMVAFIYYQKQKKSIFGKIIDKIKISENGDVSSSVIFIFTAISFGIIGTITQQFRNIIVEKRQEAIESSNSRKGNQAYVVESVSVLYRPVFGGLVGFMAYGITLLIPAILQTSSESTFVRPTALLFFCFFSGLMSDEIYDQVRRLVLKLFEVEEKRLRET